jgi:hypothetical protein
MIYDQNLFRGILGLAKRIRKNFCRGIICTFFCIALSLCLAEPSVSDNFTLRRITVGAKVFRALLAADVDIAKKKASKGKLKLYLIYLDDTLNAEKAAEVLLNRSDSRIRKIDIDIETVPFSVCVGKKNNRIGGIFLTQYLGEDKLKLLLKRSMEQHIVVFSPFEGDVERGVQCGIAVESRVRPYLNIKALQSASIHLKSFFLRVAKHYE